MSLRFGISQLAGLGDLIDGFVNGIANFFETLIQGYISLIVNWFYTIYLVFAMILDLIQVLFRKMAGLEPYIINGQAQTGTRDIALEIINSPVIKNIFWAMVILGVVLLFITTFIAVIKSEYQPLEAKGGNSKGRVIGKAMKSFVMMATVPVVALLGLFIGNALLNSIDMATSNSSNAKLSGRIFVVAAYEANRAREGTAAYDPAFVERLETENNFGIFVESGSTGFIVETVADKIDDAFQNEIDAPTGQAVDFTMTNDENPILAWLYDKIGAPNYPDTFKSSDYRLAWYYYDLRRFNFFIGIGTTIMLITILLQVLLGLIKRIYSLTILFVVVPPIMAISQLDDNIFKNWKKAFIGSAISAYSVIVTMNIFIMLIPVLGEIDFFQIDATMSEATRTIYQMFNYMAQLLIIIGGAVFFKDFTKELSGIIGGGDAMGDGAGKAKDYVNAVSKGANITKSLASPVLNAQKGALNTGFKAVRDYHQGKQDGLTGWAAASQVASNAKQSAKAKASNFFKPKDASGNRVGFLKDKANKFTKSELYKELGIGNVLTPKAKAKRDKAIEAKRHEELVKAAQGNKASQDGDKATDSSASSSQASEMDNATESYLNIQEKLAKNKLEDGPDKNNKNKLGIKSKLANAQKALKDMQSSANPDQAKIAKKASRVKELEDQKAALEANLEKEKENIMNLSKVLKHSGTDNLDNIIKGENINFKKYKFEEKELKETAQKLKKYMGTTKDQVVKDLKK